MVKNFTANFQRAVKIFNLAERERDSYILSEQSFAQEFSSHSIQVCTLQTNIVAIAENSAGGYFSSVTKIWTHNKNPLYSMEKAYQEIPL